MTPGETKRLFKQLDKMDTKLDDHGEAIAVFERVGKELDEHKKNHKWYATFIVGASAVVVTIINMLSGK